ncbi:MAG: outer membrane protein transport protein [Betaproteobacteria bacterium]|nr:outer membrane protein transport protein [Betaproteobacteria bacterium]
MTLAVRRALAATACVLPLAAFATDGYFSHGYGIKAKGMAGVSTATAEDAFGGANNPASMAFVGNRMDVGLDLFSPRRQVKREGSGGGVLDFSVDSDSTLFAIPEFGYNTMYNKDVSLGVSVYGNGGMNTDFEGGQLNCSPFGGPPSANGLCGVGRLGVDLMQLIIAPTVGWKLAPDHAIGIAPLFAYQRFRIQGAHLFTQLSQAPGNVTNNDYDSSTGFGVRVGYMGRFGPTSIGATYASKMNMGKFDKYKGLFAEDGGFDMPEHYTLGVAFRPAGGWLVGIDYKRINYSGIPSIANPSTNQAPLGSSNGPGFGWQDVDVWKFGAQFQATPELQLRAGYGKTDNPILARDVTFNILAPGVVRDHYTLGFTYALDKSSEISGSYMHAKRNSVSGASFFNAFAPGMGGTETIEMYQNALGIAWGKRW